MRQVAVVNLIFRVAAGYADRRSGAVELSAVLRDECIQQLGLHDDRAVPHLLETDRGQPVFRLRHKSDCSPVALGQSDRGDVLRDRNGPVVLRDREVFRAVPAGQDAVLSRGVVFVILRDTVGVED